jgi:hypothetical protein
MYQSLQRQADDPTMENLRLHAKQLEENERRREDRDAERAQKYQFWERKLEVLDAEHATREKEEEERKINSPGHMLNVFLAQVDHLEADDYDQVCRWLYGRRAVSRQRWDVPLALMTRPPEPEDERFVSPSAFPVPDPFPAPDFGMHFTPDQAHPTIAPQDRLSQVLAGLSADGRGATTDDESKAFAKYLEEINGFMEVRRQNSSVASSTDDAAILRYYAEHPSEPPSEAASRGQASIKSKHRIGARSARATDSGGFLKTTTSFEQKRAFKGDYGPRRFSGNDEFTKQYMLHEQATQAREAQQTAAMNCGRQQLQWRENNLRYS